MKVPILVAAVLILAGFGVYQASAGSNSSAGHLTVGTEYSALGFAPLHWVRFDPKNATLRLHTPPNGRGLARILKMPECARAPVCVNANFFGKDDVPLGLMISDGKVLRKLRKVYWGVFWIDKTGRAGVSGRREFARGPGKHQPVFAVQSGPRLLRNGKIPENLKWSLARRTALGVTRSGDGILLVSPVPVTLNHLARIARDQLDVLELVNLDGGSSTQFLSRSPEIRIDGVPIAVGMSIR